MVHELIDALHTIIPEVLQYWMIYRHEGLCQEMPNVPFKDGEVPIYLIFQVKCGKTILFKNEALDRLCTGQSMLFLGNIIYTVTTGKYKLKQSCLPNSWEFDWNLLVTSKCYDLLLYVIFQFRFKCKDRMYVVFEAIKEAMEHIKKEKEDNR